MDKTLLVSSSIFFTIAAVTFCSFNLFYILFCLFFMALGGILVFLYFYQRISNNKKSNAKCEYKCSNLLVDVISKHKSSQNCNCETKTPLRPVDVLIQRIIEYSLRDFLAPWIQEIMQKPDDFIVSLREVLWNAVQEFRKRAVRIDVEKLIAVDCVEKLTKHLRIIRALKTLEEESKVKQVFPTASYLHSKSTEVEFLENIVEILICNIFPRAYGEAKLLRKFLGASITYNLLYPLINRFTQPSFINKTIVDLIEATETNEKISLDFFESSDEEVINAIDKLNTVEELLAMRTKIINEIIKATSIQNEHKTTRDDCDKQPKSEDAKFKTYINFLSFVKNHCEKNLQRLGYELKTLSKEQTPTLSDVLFSSVGRKYFSQFLDKIGGNSLLCYYRAVEDLRKGPKTAVHQLGAGIYYTFIKAPNTNLPLNKEIRKQMELFLIGDNGPEVFYELQEKVYKELLHSYFPPFLLSEEYQQCLAAMTSSDDFVFIEGNIQEAREAIDELKEEGIDANESIYAKTKLEHIQEKLHNKMQALQALKDSIKPDTRIISMLEKSVEDIRHEKRELEAHLIRTELWSENLGFWRATVENVETSNLDAPQFIIVVHAEATKSETGWVIFKSLTDFQELHRQIRPLCDDLKSLELSSTSIFKLLFMKNEKSAVEKLKNQAQKYLNFTLSNYNCYNSECLYKFLCPSADHLRSIVMPVQKNKFSLISTLFKNDDKIDSGEEESNSIDSFEPLFSLMDELFDISTIRRSLISFIQLTYGTTINKQIRDMIGHMFEENMLHCYATTILKTFWQGGKFVYDPVVVYDHSIETEYLKDAAERLLLANIPEILSHIVSAQKAKLGVCKLLNALQDQQLNKQLFYELLETVIVELFPELILHQHT